MPPKKRVPSSSRQRKSLQVSNTDETERSPTVLSQANSSQLIALVFHEDKEDPDHKKGEMHPSECKLTAEPSVSRRQEKHMHPHKTSSTDLSSTSVPRDDYVKGPEPEPKEGSDAFVTRPNSAKYVKSSIGTGNACVPALRSRKNVDHASDSGRARAPLDDKIDAARDFPPGWYNIEVNHMEYELEREMDNAVASNASRRASDGSDDGEQARRPVGETSRRASQICPSDDETIAASESSEDLNNDANATANNNTAEDGKEWLDQELERIYTAGPSGDSGSITGGHLSGGGRILTTSSNGPRDIHAIHSTQEEMHGNAPIAIDPRHGKDRIALLNDVLSTHLDTMGNDNEAVSYMDRVARLSASSATSSMVASSTAAAATASTSHRRRSSRNLGKRSRDSSGMDGETLTGDGSPPTTAAAEEGTSSSSSSSSSAKTKGKKVCRANTNNPNKKVRSSREEEDLRNIHGRNQYSKNMKTPEPFPHERPHVSFEEDYRVNLAICMHVATGEIDNVPTASASQASAVPYMQAPSTPPMRPLPAISTAQAMPPSPTRQAMPTAPPALVMQFMQNIQDIQPIPSGQDVRSYQTMQTMHALQDMQAMDAMHGMHGMQGLPGMSGVASTVPMMPSVPIPAAMTQPMQPMQPMYGMPHSLPTPTYDSSSAAYMGYTIAAPPPPSSTMPGHGGLHSPQDDFVITGDYLAGADSMDFTDPDEIQRIMSFCEDLGSTHSKLAAFFSFFFDNTRH
jgi:hypothetical protein